MPSLTREYDASSPWAGSKSEFGSVGEKNGEPVDVKAASEGYRLAGLDRSPDRKAHTLAKEPQATSASPAQPATAAVPVPIAAPEDASAIPEAAPKSLARRVSDLIPEGMWRNLAILWGACLGSAYEVATMPNTVSNFNKAVYATTGHLGEYLPKVGGPLSFVGGALSAPLLLRRSEKQRKEKEHASVTHRTQPPPHTHLASSSGFRFFSRETLRGCAKTSPRESLCSTRTH